MKNILMFAFIFVCQIANAATYEYANDPVNLNFEPNKPVVINIPKGQTVQYVCEMHANTSSSNTLLIKELKGNSVVNGTSLETGRSLYLTIRQMQTLTIIAQPGASLQFTNLSSFLMRAICYKS